MTTKASKSSNRGTAARPRDNEPVDAEAPLDPALERAVDELEAFINRSMSEVGRYHEKVANRAFAVLFAGDVAAALAVRLGNAPKYDALARRSGATLLMDAGTLSRSVRIGAINHRLGDGTWSDLPWPHKVELLPLLGAEQDFDRLARGVAFAAKPDTTRDAVREWVASQRRAEGESEGGKAGEERKAPTPLKALKMFDMGVQLQRVAERRDLAARVRRMKASAQKEWMAALERVLKSLGRLHEELTDTGEE
jgi:hypothetical protein